MCGRRKVQHVYTFEGEMAAGLHMLDDLQSFHPVNGSSLSHVNRSGGVLVHNGLIPILVQSYTCSNNNVLEGQEVFQRMWNHLANPRRSLLSAAEVVLRRSRDRYIIPASSHGPQAFRDCRMAVLQVNATTCIPFESERLCRCFSENIDMENQPQ